MRFEQMCSLLIITLLFLTPLIYSQNVNYVVPDADGNQYPIKEIGGRYWMTENLRTTRYNDGTPIDHVTNILSPSGWPDFRKPAYCWYANDSAKYAVPYGALYNFFVISDTNIHNVCPEGWHVPNDEEWTVLTNFLWDEGYGGEFKYVAKSMASTSGWENSTFPGNVGNDQRGNNESGMSGFPGGFRSSNGSFYEIGTSGNWWTSSAAQNGKSWSRTLSQGLRRVGRSQYEQQRGFSLRCIKDLE